MTLLGQEIDVFDPENNTQDGPYTTLVFAKNKQKGRYQKLMIEVYKNTSLDISRVRYDRWARVDGTVDKYYPIGYESRIKYEGELPLLMRRAFIELAMTENVDFYSFFDEN